MYRIIAVCFLSCFIILFSSCPNPDNDNPDPGNNPPVAVIRCNQTTVTGVSLIFDGSDSYDLDENDSIDKYSWKFGDGDTAEGEATDHVYVTAGTYTVELTVTDSRGLESETAYRQVHVVSDKDSIIARGCGVICQGAFIDKRNKERTPAGYTRKVIEPLPGMEYREISHQQVPPGRAVTRNFLLDNDSFFLLDWDAVPGVEYYTICFIDQDSGEIEIWDSTEYHHSDPVFNSDYPQAYLDLSFECSGLVSVPGWYTFRICGYESDNTLSALSHDISISLGQYITGFPETILIMGNTVNWSSVDGTDGYRIFLYDNNGNKVFSFPLNPGELTSLTLISFPDLNAGEYYHCYIDSVKNDTNGNILEMTRGITGFLY